MTDAFPGAVPEIPVTDMASALLYYEEKLGFHVDWGRDGGGIAGISQAAAGSSSPTMNFVATSATRRLPWSG